MTFKCGRKTRQCRKCTHRYPKAETDLEACPECGEPRPCQNNVAAPGLACRFHGGRSLSGAAHPNFKTGKHSKYLPKRLLERYHEAIGDDELLVLREDIALLDARLADVLQRVDTGESGALWKRLREAWRDFTTARNASDAEGMADSLNEIEAAIKAGYSDYVAWADVRSILDQRRRLTDSERKRLVDAQQTMTIEKAMLLVSRLSSIVREHVSDPATLRAIADDVRNLVLVGAGEPTPTG